MTDEPLKHKISIEHGNGGAYGTWVCPFEPSDQARPCWPQQEVELSPEEIADDIGEEWEPMGLEAGTKFGCCWKDEWDDLGFELVTNTVTVEVPVKRVYFDGDGTVVELEQP